MEKEFPFKIPPVEPEERPLHPHSLKIPQEKSTPKLVTIILIIIAFLAGIAFIEYLTYCNYSKKVFLDKILPTPACSQPTSTPIPTTDTSEGWSVVSDEKSSFTIKIPPEAHASTSTKDSYPYPLALDINNLTTRPSGGGGPELVGWSIDISNPISNPNKLSLLDWASKQERINKIFHIKTLITTKTTIDNHETVILQPTPDYQLTYYLVKKSPTEVVYILIDKGNNDKLTKQILSTFKFTN